MTEMVILSTNQTVHVKTRLPWCWSWLQAKIELSTDKEARQQLIDNKFRVVEYFLDPGVGSKGRSAISLFLKDLSGPNGEYQSLCSLPGDQETSLKNIVKLAEKVGRPKLHVGYPQFFSKYGKIYKTEHYAIFVLLLKGIWR